MKKIIISFLFLLLLNIGCENKNNDAIESVQIAPLDLSTMVLNLDFGLGKKNLIKNENLSSFLDNTFNDISKMEKDLIVMLTVKDNKNFFSINDMKSLLKKSKEEKESSLRRGDPPGFYDEQATCTTCRNSGCVKDALEEGAGDGSEQIFFSMTPTTLPLIGQTGVRVYYASSIEAIVEALSSN